MNISTYGGIPSDVDTADGLTFYRALVLDDNHIYFGDDIGIRRVSKGGGISVTLASKNNSSEIAVDDTYLYWTEYAAGGDAIRRVPKVGGIVETLAVGSSLDDPYGIAVGENYVYFMEQGSGKACRLDKTAGTIFNYLPPLAYLAGAIAGQRFRPRRWTHPQDPPPRRSLILTRGADEGDC